LLAIYGTLCNLRHQSAKLGKGYMDSLMTIEDVAKFLSLSRDTVYRLAQTGRIPASKVGTQWRFKKADILEWLEANKNTSPTSTEDDLKE
jgi:PTS system nitrogen regulatory IIA component